MRIETHLFLLKSNKEYSMNYFFELSVKNTLKCVNSWSKISIFAAQLLKIYFLEKVRGEIIKIAVYIKVIKWRLKPIKQMEPKFTFISYSVFLDRTPTIRNSWIETVLKWPDYLDDYSLINRWHLYNLWCKNTLLV